MAIYRIKVESIDGTEDIDERLANGIECDGFAFLANVNERNKSVAVVHKQNLITLAAMMQASDAFRNANDLLTFVNVMGKLKGEEKKPVDEKEEFLRRVIASLNED